MPIFSLSLFLPISHSHFSHILTLSHSFTPSYQTALFISLIQLKMFGNWFKSSNQQESAQQPTWDPNTLTMQQPTSPQAPSTENVVTEQPVCI